MSWMFVFENIIDLSSCLDCLDWVRIALFIMFCIPCAKYMQSNFEVQYELFAVAGPEISRN